MSERLVPIPRHELRRAGFENLPTIIGRAGLSQTKSEDTLGGSVLRGPVERFSRRMIVAVADGVTNDAEPRPVERSGRRRIEGQV